MQITPAQQAAMEHRPNGDVRYYIVHHSDGAKTTDISQIAAMEKTRLGAVTVGYHAYVRKNPTTHLWEIQEGRTIDDVPAAAYGLNEPSYDICIAGNYHPGETALPLDTLEQDALDLVIARALAVKRKCPGLQFLIGHRDVATIKQKQGLDPADYATACPGDVLYARMHDLRVATGLHTPPILLAA